MFYRDLLTLLRREFPITLQAKNEKNKPMLAVSGPQRQPWWRFGWHWPKLFLLFFGPLTFKIVAWALSLKHFRFRFLAQRCFHFKWISNYQIIKCAKQINKTLRRTSFVLLSRFYIRGWSGWNTLKRLTIGRFSSCFLVLSSFVSKIKHHDVFTKEIILCWVLDK